MRLGRPPVHGERRISGSGTTPEYQSWKRMLQRCRSNEPAKARVYKDRGITVCKEWTKSYPSFLKNMGRKPSKHHTLDRIDNYRGYEPGNVRWAVMKEQANNRRNNMLNVCGITRSFFQWSNTFGVPQRLIRIRILAGWDRETAVLHPPFRSGPRKSGISRKTDARLWGKERR